MNAAEKMALTVARAKVDRGEGLPENIAFVVVQMAERTAKAEEQS